MPEVNDLHIATIKAAYTENLDLYRDFELSIRNLVENVLRHEGISVHTVTSRTKERESFSNKITKEPGKYKNIKQVTDVVGLRVIVYFSDDVDRVGEIIKREFEIDEENFTDKRKELALNSFGYMSLHHVIELSSRRCCLIEYKRYKGIKCEVQIRTILQHAWAEIEHDLGYKSKVDLTDEIKRRFFRIAGHLEVGDQQFMDVRDKIAEYTATTTEEIKTGKGDIEINPVSMEIFIGQSPLVANLDEKISNLVQVPLSPFYAGMSNELANHCIGCGLRFLNDVETSLRNNQNEICEMVSYQVENDGYGRTSSFASGISVFSLCFYLMAITSDVEMRNSYINEVIYTNESLERFVLAENFVKYKQPTDGASSHSPS